MRIFINADSEIVEISAYLHDISTIQDITTLLTHNVINSEIAVQWLTEQSYPLESIEKVRQCILSHLSPLQIGEGSLEEVCLSNADAISQIIKFPYLLYFAFNVRKLNFSEGKKWLRDKVESNWSKLIDPARNLVEREYMLAKACLK